MDTSRIPQLYLLARTGELQNAAAWLTPDYRHHLPAFELDFQGAEAAIFGITKMYQEFDLHTASTKVEKHGAYAVSFDMVRSNLRPEELAVVSVYRFEGDLIAECWALTPTHG